MNRRVYNSVRHNFPRKVIKQTYFPKKVNGLVTVLYRDLLFLITEFIDQQTLLILGQVCKELRYIQQNVKHYTYFFVKSYHQAKYAQQQKNLQAVVINGTRDIQHYFSTLPPYVFIGHYSSMHHCYTTYTTRILFIEEAHIDIDWSSFPNLEELYIRTTQCNLNIDKLDACINLQKIIIYTNRSLVVVDNPNILLLPKLQIFAVTGTLKASKEIINVSPSLNTYLFFSTPREYRNECKYITVFTSTLEQCFDLLFKTFHRPPLHLT